jgi:hypothetical protein
MIREPEKGLGNVFTFSEISTQGDIFGKESLK